MCRKSRLFACDTNKTHAIMILAITPATTDEINEKVCFINKKPRSGCFGVFFSVFARWLMPQITR